MRYRLAHRRTGFVWHAPIWRWHGVTVPPQLLELLCFHTQQACEKSLKAVLVHFGTAVVKTHNLQTILGLVAAHCTPSTEVAACSELTNYAVTTRYPGVYEPVTADEYATAVNTAEAVVRWAEQVIGVGF